MRIESLRTPAALVDLEVFVRNCLRMATRAAAAGVTLRPHMKTHKCVDAARIQIGESGAVTVSTLAEAEGFIASGFEDVVYAFPLSIHRIPDAAELTQRAERFAVLVDHPDTIAALDRSQRPFEVFLEVDSGAHRSGVDPSGDRCVELARRIVDAPHLTFRGLLTHAGQSYAESTAEGILRVAETERRIMVDAAERLRSEGIEVNDVSVGSTPSCAVAREWSGVTEIRPGNYAFFDLYQRAIGACQYEDIAQSVLATIVSIHPERREFIVDAGSLALSLDPGATHVEGEWGFGIVFGLESQVDPGVRVAKLSQEHGLVRDTTDAGFDRWRVGDRVRILPNHSCLTAALYGSYQLTSAGEVVAEWIPLRGW